MKKKCRYLFLFILVPTFLISCATKKTDVAVFVDQNKKEVALLLKDDPPKKIAPLPLFDITIAKLEGKEIPDFDKQEEEFLKEESIRIGKIPKKREIKKFLFEYSTTYKKFIQKSLERGSYFIPMVKSIFREYGLPEELVYLPIIESGYNPYATSCSGAAGIWQFMPQTGKRFGLKINSYIDERRDPYKSSIAAAKYLKYLYKYLGRWDLAIAAYNCGEGCIKAYTKNGSKTFWSIKNKLPKQTKEYVPRFFAVSLIVRNPAKYGFYIPKQNIYVARKKLKRNVSLKDISLRYDINFSILKFYNAHFIKGKAIKGAGVNLPSKSNFAKFDYKIKRVKYTPKSYKHYLVKRGDTLYKLSKRFNISIEKIKKVNKIKGNTISVGTIIKIPNS